MGRRGYSPSPPRGGYERRRRSPSPRSRYSGAGSRGRPVERDLPTSLLVRNLRLDCREPRGFGFVQYVEPADAAEAKYQMDGQVLQGREMTVVFAEDNRKKPSDMKIRERRSGSRYNERGRRSPPRRYSPPPPPRRARSPPPRRSRSRSHSRDYSPPPPKRRHHSRSRSPISPRGGKRYSKERSPISPRGGKRSYSPSPARKRSPPHNGASRSPSPVRDRSPPPYNGSRSPSPGKGKLQPRSPSPEKVKLQPISRSRSRSPDVRNHTKTKPNRGASVSP
ncbi:serine/arginine-rich SC35-like splicing factor SCL30A [Tanacetum coccineum]